MHVVWWLWSCSGATLLAPHSCPGTVLSWVLQSLTNHLLSLGEKRQKLAPWSCSSSLSWLEFTASFDVYQYITSRCSCQDHVLVKVIYNPPKAYSKQLHTTCRSRKIRDQHRWQEPSQRGPRSPLDILLTNTGLPLSNCVCQGMPPRRCVTPE